MGVDSVNMTTETDDGPRHFPRDSLNLRDDETGARFWSVSLRCTQLTYFEVGPNCRFAAHSHPSEQITLVLEGELFFETITGITRIGTGEVMAIPANVHHAVYTKTLAAKAVDAWSPVNKKYLDGPLPAPPNALS